MSKKIKFYMGMLVSAISIGDKYSMDRVGEV